MNMEENTINWNKTKQKMFLSCKADLPPLDLTLKTKDLKHLKAATVTRSTLWR